MVRTMEEVEAELKQLFQQANQETVELDDILLEHEGNVLVRKSLLMQLGEHTYFGERFEIWTDKSKYEASQLKGANHRELYNYCANYAGFKQEDIIEQFKQKFGMS